MLVGGRGARNGIETHDPCADQTVFDEEREGVRAADHVHDAAITGNGRWLNPRLERELVEARISPLIRHDVGAADGDRLVAKETETLGPVIEIAAVCGALEAGDDDLRGGFGPFVTIIANERRPVDWIWKLFLLDERVDVPPPRAQVADIDGEELRLHGGHIAGVTRRIMIQPGVVSV